MSTAPALPPLPGAPGGPALPSVEEFANVEGRGVQGIVDGHAVVVGRASLLADRSQHLSAGLAAVKAEAEAQGKTAIAVGWDGRARGVLVVADTVKATSAEAVAQLRALGLTLRAGQVVTTGTCHPPLPIGSGDRMDVDFGDLGRVSVRFA